MTGLQTLAYALGMTAPLLILVFVLSRLLVRVGLAGIAALISFFPLSMSILQLSILPGIVIHELSHYFACLLTLTPVLEVRLFSPQPDGTMGWVRHAETGPIRRLVIALAPFIGCSVVMYLLIRFGFPSDNIDQLRILPDDLLSGIQAALDAVIVTLRSADLRSILTWVLLDILFATAVAIAPSDADLAPLTAFVIGISVVLIGLYVANQYFGWGLERSSLLNGMAGLLGSLLQYFNALLLFAVAVVGIVALFVVPVGLIGRFVRG